MNTLILTVKHALMITGFVGLMMLVIEYINVMTRGQWQEHISRRRWGQYLLAALLGATPGCLGAFAIVAMYSHRTLSVGAVVTAMIATAGDESFVMFAMIPKTALLLHGILILLGIISGALADSILGHPRTPQLTCTKDFHIHEEYCECFPAGKIRVQWKYCSPSRGILTAFLALFLLAIITGQIGPPVWNWIRVTLAAFSCVSLFIVATVPDHFLEEHLWNHVVREHIPRIFLWTSAALFFLHFLVDQEQIVKTIQQKQWMMLGIAGLVGVIPESGPHLIFVTMFSKDLIPFSILLTNSIVQDGHGMLPLLAHSRRAFFIIKLINLFVGLVVGAVVMIFGG
jgi:hypothetical protein